MIISTIKMEFFGYVQLACVRASVDVGLIGGEESGVAEYDLGFVTP